MDTLDIRNRNGFRGKKLRSVDVRKKVTQMYKDDANYLPIRQQLTEGEMIALGSVSRAKQRDSTDDESQEMVIRASTAGDEVRVKMVGSYNLLKVLNALYVAARIMMQLVYEKYAERGLNECVDNLLVLLDEIWPVSGGTKPSAEMKEVYSSGQNNQW